MSEKTTCAACGMPGEPREYHPFAVCELFKSLRHSKTVLVNIRAVVEYGMKAERYGVSLDDAMRDINNVSDKEFPKANAAKPI